MKLFLSMERLTVLCLQPWHIYNLRQEIEGELFEVLKYDKCLPEDQVHVTGKQLIDRCDVKKDAEWFQNWRWSWEGKRRFLQLLQGSWSSFIYKGNDGELRLGVRRAVQLTNVALLEAVINICCGKFFGQ